MSYRSELFDQLKLHEGVRDTPYEDTEGHLTLGVGHNLSKPISPAVIELMLSEDVEDAEADLDRIFSPWRDLSKNRKLALVDMMFNLGSPSFVKFYRFWKAMTMKEYDDAAKEMLNSKWAEQVGQRAVRLSEMMRLG